MAELNSYDLSRSWFDWCFENPDKIKPAHTALYFFCIEHCNRLGWKDKFGLPTQMAMEAIGIKNWRTYSSTFEDLVEYGFIKVIERSKNQWSATVIAIVKNTKANTKALSKATQKHLQKQSSSTVVIDKPINQEQYCLTFADFWEIYDKKVGDKESIKKKFETLNNSDLELIKKHIPLYINSTPDKKFRKDPKTYLNQKGWNDEIIGATSQGVKVKLTDIEKHLTEKDYSYVEGLKKMFTTTDRGVFGRINRYIAFCQSKGITEADIDKFKEGFGKWHELNKNNF